MPLSQPAQASTDGWISDSRTWTYASASTFTIAGVDVTSQFPKGTRLKFTQTTAKYAVVIASSFSTNTTVTIATNTDYTIANAAITAPYYSYDASPQGYPTFFNFALTEVGWSATPTSELRYAIVGNCLTVLMYVTGTSDSTTTTVDFPVALDGNAGTAGGVAYIVNNGTPSFGRWYANSSTQIKFGVSASSDTWTASGTKTINCTFIARF